MKFLKVKVACGRCRRESEGTILAPAEGDLLRLPSCGLCNEKTDLRFVSSVSFEYDAAQDYINKYYGGNMARLQEGAAPTTELSPEMARLAAKKAAEADAQAARRAEIANDPNSAVNKYIRLHYGTHPK